MERRRELRVEANAPAVVTELGPPSFGGTVEHRHEPMGGMIQDMSDGGMSLKVPRAIACNTPVRIETGTMLLLGEVVRCEPAGEQFRVALAVRHSLQNLQDLAKLNRALLGCETPAEEQTPQERASAAPIMRE